MDKKIIEKAILETPITNSFHFVLAKDASTKAIQKAISHYAKNITPSDVVAIMDTTVFNSGKNGYLFTSDALYSSAGLNKKINPLPLNGLQSVSTDDSFCYATYTDGSSFQFFTSIHSEIYEILKKIIKGQQEPVIAKEPVIAEKPVIIKTSAPDPIAPEPAPKAVVSQKPAKHNYTVAFIGRPTDGKQTLAKAIEMLAPDKNFDLVIFNSAQEITDYLNTGGKYIDTFVPVVSLNYGPSPELEEQLEVLRENAIPISRLFMSKSDLIDDAEIAGLCCDEVLSTLDDYGYHQFADIAGFWDYVPHNTDSGFVYLSSALHVLQNATEWFGGILLLVSGIESHDTYAPE